MQSTLSFNYRLFKIAVSLALYACDWLGAILLRCFGISPPGTCVILYYHAIRSNERELFRRQMDLLAKFATPVAINFKGSFQPSKKYAAVTFDDAFANVFENAIPILLQIGIPAIIFVPPKYLGRNPGWIVDKTRPESSLSLVDHNTLAAANKVVTIGSHTFSHARLTSLPPSQIKNELIQSRQALEHITKKPIEFLSFPYGAYNSEIIRIALDLGYRKLFTIEPKIYWNHLNHATIGRVEILPSDYDIEFYLKSVGAYRWMAAASRTKQKLRQAFF